MWIAARLALGIAVLTAAWGCYAATSPYADETDRQIKSLSPSELEGYLAGRGMGLAKAAELNGYPGPKHVLELAEKLQLSSEQREHSQALYEEMLTEAQRLGKQIAEQEGALDRTFGGGDITARQVDTLTADIAELLGKLRAVHLHAHLKQRAVLTEHQVGKYAQLRGYAHGDHAHHSERSH